MKVEPVLKRVAAQRGACGVKVETYAFEEELVPFMPSCPSFFDIVLIDRVARERGVSNAT